MAIIGHVEPICPGCATLYTAFRTGHTFASIRQEMHVGSLDSSEWRRKRRGSVLGYWREVKVAAWRYHVDQCLASLHVANDNRPTSKELEAAPF